MPVELGRPCGRLRPLGSGTASRCRPSSGRAPWRRRRVVVAVGASSSPSSSSTSSSSSSSSSTVVVGVVVVRRSSTSSVDSSTGSSSGTRRRLDRPPPFLLATSPSFGLVRPARDADIGDPTGAVAATGQAWRRGDRTRTCNLRFWRPLRYQLRHTPTRRCAPRRGRRARAHRDRGDSPHGATSVRVRPGDFPTGPPAGSRPSGGRPDGRPGHARAPSRRRRWRSGRSAPAAVG